MPKKPQGGVRIVRISPRIGLMSLFFCNVLMAEKSLGKIAKPAGCSERSTSDTPPHYLLKWNRSYRDTNLNHSIEKIYSYIKNEDTVP